MSEQAATPPKEEKGTSLVKTKAESIKTFVKDNTAAIASALPRIGLTAEALTRTALTQIYANPKLLDCSKQSLVKSIIEAAQLGLPFQLGRGYLVPRWNSKKGTMEAQFQPGYLGLLDLVRRANGDAVCVAEAVYEGDVFEYERGLDVDKFRHISRTEPDPAKLTHVYCIIRIKDAGSQFGVMTRAMCESVRKRSPAANAGPWITDYAAMCIKTVIKKVAKLAPMSVELQRAIQMDEAVDSGAAFVEEPEDIETPEHTEAKPSTVETLKERLGKEKKSAAKKAEVLEAEVVTTTGVPAETIADIKLVLLERNGGSQSRAEVMLSEMTGGKLQKWADLEGPKLTSDLLSTIDAAISSAAEAGA